VIHHRADRIDLQAFARGLHLDQEHREPFGALLDLLARRGARRAAASGRNAPRAEVQIFWPVDDVAVVAVALPPVVRSASVSVPDVGSVTPKACRRNSPLAISADSAASGRRCRAAAPCPIVYICAWQAAPLQPRPGSPP
jgi:hypothetical protein